jgi:hypothetical protein
MRSRAGEYLCGQRRARRLSSRQLAAAVGYTNPGKGANRILVLEREGAAAGPLLDNVINVLGLSGNMFARLSLTTGACSRTNGNAGLAKGGASAAVLSDRGDLVQRRGRQSCARKRCSSHRARRLKMMQLGEIPGPVSRLRGRDPAGFHLSVNVEDTKPY